MSPLEGPEFGKWNYRVVKREIPVLPDEPDGEIEVEYGIHECHYDDDKLGWTRFPVEVSAESVEGLRWVLDKMRLALELEVIDDNDR